jgi:hypothetical protein
MVSVRETAMSVAVSVRTLPLNSKRIFSRIGIVDFDGITPPSLDNIRCNSVLLTANFIELSLGGGTRGQKPINPSKLTIFEEKCYSDCINSLDEIFVFSQIWPVISAFTYQQINLPT